MKKLESEKTVTNRAYTLQRSQALRSTHLSAKGTEFADGMQRMRHGDGQDHS